MRIANAAARTCGPLWMGLVGAEWAVAADPEDAEEGGEPGDAGDEVLEGAEVVGF